MDPTGSMDMLAYFVSNDKDVRRTSTDGRSSMDRYSSSLPTSSLSRTSFFSSSSPRSFMQSMSFPARHSADEPSSPFSRTTSLVRSSSSAVDAYSLPSEDLDALVSGYALRTSATAPISVPSANKNMGKNKFEPPPSPVIGRMEARSMGLDIGSYWEAHFTSK